MLCHVSGGIFCQACGGEGYSKGEREAGVRGILWSNWVGVTMRMTNTMFGTGKAVVMYSVFCVIKGIVVIIAHGVYGTAVIKKKIYWPN